MMRIVDVLYSVPFIFVVIYLDYDSQRTMKSKLWLEGMASTGSRSSYVVVGADLLADDGPGGARAGAVAEA